ncbi:NUDIX hydrolase [Streptomyces sp. NRRL S-448]|uniref:NUDIX hydrolase n=1 Tax=Streptomyces sp. NRRL S-448 TaxID=1463907 RepID=UPI0035617F05
MPEKVTKEKVLVYVVRDGRLLVFRHTDYSYEEVGIQVPAGSIRPGETPEAAALREAREETGLSDFKIVRKLGETKYDISPYRFEIQHRHVFHLELTEPTPERWMSREDHDGKQAPTYFECFWKPRTFSSPAKARCWGVCPTSHCRWGRGGTDWQWQQSPRCPRP